MANNEEICVGDELDSTETVLMDRMDRNCRGKGRWRRGHRRRVPLLLRFCDVQVGLRNQVHNEVDGSMVARKDAVWLEQHVDRQRQRRDERELWQFLGNLGAKDR